VVPGRWLNGIEPLTLTSDPVKVMMMTMMITTTMAMTRLATRKIRMALTMATLRPIRQVTRQARVKTPLMGVGREVLPGLPANLNLNLQAVTGLSLTVELAEHSRIFSKTTTQAKAIVGANLPAATPCLHSNQERPIWSLLAAEEIEVFCGTESQIGLWSKAHGHVLPRTLVVSKWNQPLAFCPCTRGSVGKISHCVRVLSIPTLVTEMPCQVFPLCPRLS
jgi:hypothetical protein